MSGNAFIVNVGELSRPATVLIEKISDAVGGIFRPYQIRRVAKADAEAAKIMAVSQIEISELQQRALVRFVGEEAQKKANMESIAQKAIEDVEDNARPQDVENDWISNFYDKSRIISNKEMQTLWSKILAGEANKPGTYSKRTVNLLASLDKGDAALFTKVCGFGWFMGEITPLVFDPEASIYTEKGVHFDVLKHLDDIGLISFGSLGGYKRKNLRKRIAVAYFGSMINIEFKKDEANDLDIGKVLLSKVGQELAPICGAQPVEGFVEFVLKKWSEKGVVVSSPWPRPGSGKLPTPG